MPSSNPRADRLAKSLQLCLSQAMGGMPRLRALGWFELLQDDWPVSELAPEVAFEAMFHLSVDADGRWDGNPAVVVGIVNFLRQQTGKFPTPLELKDLRQMLASTPVDRRGIERWFETVFG
jgi:hypothetical protein